MGSAATATHIERISQGGFAKCTANFIKVRNKPWISETSKKESPESVIDTLQSLTTFFCDNSKNLSLSLSGGMDSRVLLALLLANNKDFFVHTFGNSKSQDNIISKALARGFSLKISSYGENKCSFKLAALKDFVGATNSISPVSAIQSAGFYKDVHAENKVIIDGGFGEIARRRYLNRLLLSGKKEILTNDFDGIIKYLQLDRSPVFNS